MFTKFAVPSFVVTLAGLLAWPGFQLEVLGETGTVNLNDPKIIGLTSTFYSDTVGWIIAVVAIGLYAFTALRGRQKRVSQGLSAPQVGLLVLRIGLVAVATLVAVWVLNDDRGVPLAALILVGFCLASSTSRRGPRSGATSSPWAATPRRHGGPASTSRACA